MSDHKKKKRTPVIQRDSKGRRYVTINKKRVVVEPEITDQAFLKWLIKYLKPKRKKKTKAAKVSKTFTPSAADPLILLPELADNENVRNYVNAERKAQQKPPFMPPVYAGGPPMFEFQAIEEGPRELPPLSLPEPEPPVLAETPRRPKKEGKEEKKYPKTAPRPSTKKQTIDFAGKQFEVEDSPGVTEAITGAKVATFEAGKNRFLTKHPHDDLSKFVAQLPKDKGFLSIAVTKNNRKYNKTDLLNRLVEYEHKAALSEITRHASDIMQGKGHDEAQEPGMMTDDINKLMDTYKPHYLGTIARDEWKLLTPPSTTGKSAWIMNTDRHDQPGKHWVAFLIDIDGHSIEYYNSFADDIPADVLISIKQFVATHNVTKYYLKLKVNHVIDQDANSSNCGWFACKFIIDRFRNKPWRECTKYDEHVKGEAAIAAFKKKHGDYTYL